MDRQRGRANRARNTRIVLALVLLCATLSRVDAGRAAASRPWLEVIAPSSAAVGEPILMTLVLHDAPGIAGYEIAARFDTAAAHFNGLSQRGNDLARQGRSVEPLGAVELPEGVVFGLYSCAVGACVDSLPPTSDAGARGTLQLAQLALVADQPGLLDVRFDTPIVVDGAGNRVDVDANISTLSVQVGAPDTGVRHTAPPSSTATRNAPSQPAGPFDLTGDRLVTYADAMEVALAWLDLRERAAPCGNLPDPSRDVNHDGCIDVADVQNIVAQYGSDQPVARVAAPLVALTFTVDSIGDEPDAVQNDGRCATAVDTCTLRAAISAANTHRGPDTITFAIPGAGVQTIQLASSLPSLSDSSGPTIIDGYTQPGSQPNTDPFISNAIINVQIAAAGVGKFNVLNITAPSNTVRGVALFKLNRGIALSGAAAHDNWITGNFLGTDAVGVYSSPSTGTHADGVMMRQGAARNHVGSADLAGRNVVSGNASCGISTYDEGTTANVIVNNIIGLNPSGTKRLPNRYHGVDINVGSSYNIVGGTNPGERNVASGNGHQGMEISHFQTTVGNALIGNLIGTDVTGTTATSYTANGLYGVRVEDGVSHNRVDGNVIGRNGSGGIRLEGYSVGNQISNNRIGISLSGRAIPNGDQGILVRLHASRSQIGPGNIIANNPVGIVIADADNDAITISHNAIFNNTGLGIDLAPVGQVNLNDLGDGDSGPNQQLNFPLLERATVRYVAGMACAGCIVEVFMTDVRADGYGEGQQFVGSGTANGDGSFAFAVSGLSVGDYVSSTATDGSGNTSEFSRNLVVGADDGTTIPTSAATSTPTSTATNTPTNTPTGTPSSNVSPTPTNTPNSSTSTTPTSTPSNAASPSPTSTSGSPTSTVSGIPSTSTTSVPTDVLTGTPPAQTPTLIDVLTSTPTATAPGEVHPTLSPVQEPAKPRCYLPLVMHRTEPPADDQSTWRSASDLIARPRAD